jgi:hypothetical protein
MPCEAKDRTLSLFLSHSQRDKQFARKLANDLTARGVHVWLDEAVMFLGDSLLDKIRNAIEKVDYFAVILSRRSVVSDWVHREIEIAMQSEIAGRHIDLLPIVIEDCELPAVFEGRVVADFRVPEQYQHAFDLIVRRLGLPDHPSRMLKAGGMQWPIPDEAFAEVELLNLHIAFYDGKQFMIQSEFLLGRMTTGGSSVIGDFGLPRLAKFWGISPDDAAQGQIAHYESKSWLKIDRTFAQEGVKSGDHLIWVFGSGLAEDVSRISALFRDALRNIQGQGFDSDNKHG